MYKLSIVVPIYGVEDYLCKCLDSIYSQITDECQVLLVDDQSPDRCGEICEEYKAKYPNTVVIHQENMGLGGARNSGIKVAEGEYLYFIDSDDYIPMGAVKTVLDAIEKYGADVMVFPMQGVDENGAPIHLFKDSLPCGVTLKVSENKNAIIGHPNACGKITKTSLFNENDIYFPSKVWYEDIRTMPKIMAKTSSVVYLDTPIYYYLQRDGSIMNNAKVDRNTEIIDAMEDLEAWFKNEGLYEQYKSELDYLTIDHVFVSATVRILRSVGASHPLVKKFREYTFGKIAGGSLSANRYVTSGMPRNRKIILTLLKAKMYFAVKLIFKIKG